MNIAWSPEAIEDLASLRAYIAEDDPTAARRVVLQILQNVERLLPDNPQIGRAGRVPGRCEWRGLLLNYPFWSITYPLRGCTRPIYSHSSHSGHIRL